MSDIRRECPQCGRKITQISATGKIGFCEYHKQWFPFSTDAEAEASEANRKYREELARKKAEQEEKARREQEEQVRKKKRSLGLKIGLVLLVLILAAIALFVFKILPENRYKEAEALFEAGQYQEAIAKYEAMNGYQDSEKKIALSEAFLELQKGNTEEALIKLNGIESMSGSESFQFIYDSMKERCLANTDKTAAYTDWAAFLESYKFEIEKYELTDDYQQVLTQLKLEYADLLAKQKDPACISLYEEAAAAGADISTSVTAAIDYFGAGLSRNELRKVLISAQEAAGQDASEQQGLLKDEIKQYINDWKSLNLDTSDVYELLREAKDLGIEGIDSVSVSKDLGLAIVNQQEDVSKYLYLDPDGDGVEELFVFTKDGTLKTYSVNDSFKSLSQISTDLAGGTISEEETAFLVLAADRSAFCVISKNAAKPQMLYREEGIIDYQKSDAVITYGKELEGSIFRSMRYSYSLETPEQDAAVTEIYWQAEDYPYPETPADSVRRYYEAKGYAIADEEAALTAKAKGSPVEGFAAEGLSSLPLPAAPYTIDAASYDKEEEYCLVEAQYQSGRTNVTKYFVLVLEDDQWKIAGTADAFAAGMEEASMEKDLPVLSLNEFSVGHLTDKDDKDAYRLLLPEAARIQMVWQAGEKQGSANAYKISVFDADDLSESLISYELTLSPSRQMAAALYLDAGVYYVQVEPLKYEDIDYRIMFQTERDVNMEKEDNNTPETANPIELNTVYSASLYVGTDVDHFSFDLEEPGAVNVVLSGSKDGTKQTLYEFKLFNNSGTQLTQGALTGLEDQAETGNIYLDKGSYYVQISKGKGWTSWDYQLEIKVDAAEGVEIEPNDTAETANQIQVNLPVTGIFGAEGDIDQYSFTLDKDMIVQPGLTFAPADSSETTYILQMSKDGKALAIVNIAGNESGKAVPPQLLTAGTYTVRVENPLFIKQEYQLIITAIEAEVIETESNNSPETANKIKIGDHVTGVLSSKDDVDYFSFTLEEPGAAEVVLTGYGNGSAKTQYTVQLLDKDGQVLITGSELAGNVTEASTGTVYLNSGEYTVCVNIGAAWTAWDYRLEVRSEHTDNTEAEINNTVETANPIPVNQEITGSFAVEGDVDYYQFTLDTDKVIQLKLNFTPLEASTKTYVMTLFQGDQVIQAANIGGKENNKVIAPLALKAGTYLLKVDNPNYIRQDYTVSITAIDVALAETEPNDELAAANSLGLDETITGVLSKAEDVDSYLVKLEEETIVKVSFSFTPASGTATAFVLQLEQGGKTLWSANITAESGGDEQTLQIPAGEYYLRVKASSWISAVYSLGLTTIEQ